MTRPVFRKILGFIFALVFLGQGITAPFQNDEETRPAGIIIDVVNHGDWLIPVDLHGELTRKPPLFYWTAAAVARARGRPVDEAGARIVSLIAAAATAVIVMELAAAQFGVSAGLLAYLFLLGTYGFASRACLARTDMLFTFLVFAAYSALYPIATAEGSAVRAVLVGALLGLGILTKGPLALALCVAGIVMYFTLMGRNPLALLLRYQSWLVLAVASLIAAAWYVPAFKWNPKLFQVQLVEENFGHFLPSQLGGTGEAARPIYYILVRFIGATLPLNFYLPAVLPNVLRERKSGSMLIYQAGLLIATLAIFTISSAKRDDYILTALPSFAMLLAAPFALNEANDTTSARLANSASCLAALSLLVLTLAGLTAYESAAFLQGLTSNFHPSDAAYLSLFLSAAGDHSIRIALTATVVIVASVLALGFAWKRRSATAAWCIGLAELAVVSLWIGLLMPQFARRHTLKTFVLEAKAIVGRRGVAIVGAPNYEVSYYFGRGIPAWRRPWVADNRARDPDYLFAWSAQLDQLGPKERLPQSSVVLVSHPISSRGSMMLLRIARSPPGDTAR
jgi:4-amino-4-deoxy-L-arabinose transferase-like glycosyltransferase